MLNLSMPCGKRKKSAEGGDKVTNATSCPRRRNSAASMLMTRSAPPARKDPMASAILTL
jgi:hypothetical protein